MKYISLILSVSLVILCIVPHNIIAENNNCNWCHEDYDSTFSNSVPRECSPGRYLKRIWETEAPGSHLSEGDEGLAFFCHDDIVYVANSNDSILLIDSNNGEILMDFEVFEEGKKLKNTCLYGIHNDQLIVYGLSENYRITSSFDVNSLEKIWSRKDPRTKDGISLCTFKNNSFYQSIDWKKMEKVDLKSDDKTTYIEGEFVGFPIISNNKLIFQLNTKLVCSDITKFSKQWEIDFEDRGYSVLSSNEQFCFGAYYKHPASGDAKLVCISINDGKVVWEDSIWYDSLGYPEITVDENNLYITASQTLYCYNPKNGKLKWKHKNDGFLNGVVSDNENLFFSNGKVFYILDANTGSVLNSFDEKKPYSFFIDIEIANRKLFHYDNANGILTCFGKAGTIVVKYKIDKKSYSVDNIEHDSDIAPAIVNDRTLLSARYVTEPLGGSVSWDGTERKVICTLGDKTIELWIGKPTARIDGVETQIDPDNPEVIPTIIDGRTMVPMRFLAESLGCEVEWVPDTKEIVLRYSK